MSAIRSYKGTAIGRKVCTWKIETVVSIITNGR